MTDCRSIFWDGTQYIVTSQRPGYIFVSTPVSWERRFTGISSFDALDVSNGPGGVYGVGASGRIYFSTDVGTWSQKSGGNGAAFTDLAKREGLLLATDGVNKPLLSHNGIDWLESSIEHPFANLLWTGQRFIGHSGGNFLTSMDGNSGSTKNQVG